MNPKSFRLTLCAAAIAQAFVLPAQAQSTSDKNLPEVVVQAPRAGGQAASAAIGGFGDQPLLQTPASIGVIGQAEMQDLQVRSVTDVVRFDTSVNESYNAVGYAEQFSIRGFKLDNSRGYRKDGLAIPGDATIPLENKERVEVLKGLAGLAVGSAAPGGVLNFVTKRPTNEDLRSLTFGLSERGTRYGAVDLGGSSADHRFGYRINLAAEGLRSYVKGADGNRHLAAAAFDFRPTQDLLLQLDMDYQYRSQLSQPGFQLYNGTDLPINVDPAAMLNNQPWSKPVTTRTGNLGLRLEARLNDSWTAVAQANKHRFSRDDYAAFPWGCGRDGLYPGYCANGDFDVYDYQSAGERQEPFAAQAYLNGRLRTGDIGHALTLGVSTYRRRDYAGDCVYGMVDCNGSVANGSSNIFHPVVVPAAPIATGPVVLVRSDDERAAFVQDIVTLAPQWKLHAGARFVRLERNAYSQNAVLPNLAAVYSPQQNIALYASYASGLEAGGIAPLGTLNYRQQLAPNKSRQFEGGIKADLNADVSLAAALFEIRKPLEFSKLLNPTDSAETFVRAGDAVHRGVELSAATRPATNLRMIYSLAAIRARQESTGFASLDGKRVTDVPELKIAAVFDYTIAAVPGLAATGRWTYSSDKAFDVDNKTIVPSYNVFDLGLRYGARVGQGMLTLRFAVENLTDRFYWRDVTPALGGYLYPGAPRLYRATAQYDF